MKKQIIIEYDIVEETIEIVSNEFSTFEAFGMLEAAKELISRNWLKENE